VVATYYDVLGVSVEARADEVRRAYLELARRLHPDRAPGSDRAMQRVNEAWSVLRDPVRRAEYDRALARVATATVPPAQRASRTHDEEPDLDTPIAHTLAEPGDLGVSIARMVPWIAIAVVLGAIFVFTAFAGNHRSDDPQALLGSCVSLIGASSVERVPCTSPNDGRVERVVGASSGCTSGSTARRQGSSWLCLGPDDPGASSTTSTSVP
jgi:hypothetical protein